MFAAKSTKHKIMLMQQGDADLSRRCINHDIRGLSFREFLRFYKNIDLPKYTLEQILDNPWPLVEEVNDKCRPLQYFSECYRCGLSGSCIDAKKSSPAGTFCIKMS